MSRKYLGYGLPQADLIQEGNIGLMKAVRRFDPERGVRLVSFALHWIRAEIHEYILRNWRLVKVATTKAQRKLFFNLRSMKALVDRADARPRRTRSRRSSASSPRKWSRWRRASRAATSRSTRRPGDEDVGDADRLPDRLRTTSRRRSSSARETATNRSEGLHARDGASSTTAAAGSSRRAGCARTTPATLQELADEYGVSAERIRQIESKAMKTMRSQMVTLQ